MSGTRTFAVINDLVSAWRAVSGYGAPTESGVIPIFDGVADVDTPTRYVLVGARQLMAGDDADDTAASSDAEWRSMPVDAGHQRETVTVPCVVGGWTGEGDGIVDWSELRTDLESILDDLDAALRVRTATTAGQITITFKSGSLRQVFATDGAAAEFGFDVEFVVNN